MGLQSRARVWGLASRREALVVAQPHPKLFVPPASRSWGAGGFLYPGKSARHLVPSNTFPGTWAGLSPIAVRSELIAVSDAVSPTMTYPFGAGSGSVKLLPSIVASMVSPGRASWAHREATPSCIANSMSTVSASGSGSTRVYPR